MEKKQQSVLLCSVAVLVLVSLCCTPHSFPMMMVSAQWSFSGPGFGCNYVLESYTEATWGNFTSGAAKTIVIDDVPRFALFGCTIRGALNIVFNITAMRAVAVAAAYRNVSISIQNGVQFEALLDSGGGSSGSGAILRIPTLSILFASDTAPISSMNPSALPVDISIGGGQQSTGSVSWTVGPPQVTPGLSVPAALLARESATAWSAINIVGSQLIPRQSRIAITNISVLFQNLQRVPWNASSAGAGAGAAPPPLSVDLRFVQNDNRVALILRQGTRLLMQGNTIQFINVHLGQTPGADETRVYLFYQYYTITRLEDDTLFMIGGSDGDGGGNSRTGGNMLTATNCSFDSATFTIAHHEFFSSLSLNGTANASRYVMDRNTIRVVNTTTMRSSLAVNILHRKHYSSTDLTGPFAQFLFTINSIEVLDCRNSSTLSSMTVTVLAFDFYSGVSSTSWRGGGGGPSSSSGGAQWGVDHNTVTISSFNAPLASIRGCLFSADLSHLVVSGDAATVTFDHNAFSVTSCMARYVSLYLLSLRTTSIALHGGGGGGGGGGALPPLFPPTPSLSIHNTTFSIVSVTSTDTLSEAVLSLSQGNIDLQNNSTFAIADVSFTVLDSTAPEVGVVVFTGGLCGITTTGSALLSLTGLHLEASNVTSRNVGTLAVVSGFRCAISLQDASRIKLSNSTVSVRKKSFFAEAVSTIGRNNGLFVYAFNLQSGSPLTLTNTAQLEISQVTVSIAEGTAMWAGTAAVIDAIESSISLADNATILMRNTAILVRDNVIHAPISWRASPVAFLAVHLFRTGELAIVGMLTAANHTTTTTSITLNNTCASVRHVSIGDLYFQQYRNVAAVSPVSVLATAVGTPPAAAVENAPNGGVLTVVNSCAGKTDTATISVSTTPRTRTSSLSASTTATATRSLETHSPTRLRSSTTVTNTRSITITATGANTPRNGRASASSSRSQTPSLTPPPPVVEPAVIELAPAVVPAGVAVAVAAVVATSTATIAADMQVQSAMGVSRCAEEAAGGAVPVGAFRTLSPAATADTCGGVLAGHAILLSATIVAMGIGVLGTTLWRLRQGEPIKPFGPVVLGAARCPSLLLSVMVFLLSGLLVCGGRAEDAATKALVLITCAVLAAIGPVLAALFGTRQYRQYAAPPLPEEWLCTRSSTSRAAILALAGLCLPRGEIIAVGGAAGDDAAGGASSDEEDPALPTIANASNASNEDVDDDEEVISLDDDNNKNNNNGEHTAPIHRNATAPFTTPAVADTAHHSPVSSSAPDWTRMLAAAVGPWRLRSPVAAFIPQLSILALVPAMLAHGPSCVPLHWLSAVGFWAAAALVVTLRPRRVVLSDLLHAAALATNGGVLAATAVRLAAAAATTSTTTSSTSSGTAAAGDAGAAVGALSVVITVLTILRIVHALVLVAAPKISAAMRRGIEEAPATVAWTFIGYCHKNNTSTTISTTIGARNDSGLHHQKRHLLSVPLLEDPPPEEHFSLLDSGNNTDDNDDDGAVEMTPHSAATKMKRKTESSSKAASSSSAVVTHNSLLKNNNNTNKNSKIMEPGHSSSSHHPAAKDSRGGRGLLDDVSIPSSASMNATRTPSSTRCIDHDDCDHDEENNKDCGDIHLLDTISPHQQQHLDDSSGSSLCLSDVDDNDGDESTPPRRPKPQLRRHASNNRRGSRNTNNKNHKNSSMVSTLGINDPMFMAHLRLERADRELRQTSPHFQQHYQQQQHKTRSGSGSLEQSQQAAPSPPQQQVGEDQKVKTKEKKQTRKPAASFRGSDLL